MVELWLRNESSIFGSPASILRVNGSPLMPNMPSGQRAGATNSNVTFRSRKPAPNTSSRLYGLTTSALFGSSGFLNVISVGIESP